MNVYGLGDVKENSGLFPIDECSDGLFKTGCGGVRQILSVGDKKVEFICFENKTLAFVKSAFGFPAYYPIEPVELRQPVKAVLMDLDGTTVTSESFWIWIIEQTVSTLKGDSKFVLNSEDLPFVSGHSVSEHLQYCIDKYCPEKSIVRARELYHSITAREMDEIMNGRGREGAFTPKPGIKEFLLALKARNIKIGLVTSGLYRKAYPEILSAFRELKMGEPTDFYDTIITAGFPLEKGAAGTLGELCPKPHPWLYAEALTGLGLSFADRNNVIGIEDSGAGVCSIRLCNVPVIGISGGNILESGTLGLCEDYCDEFEQILKHIDG